MSSRTSKAEGVARSGIHCAARHHGFRTARLTSRKSKLFRARLASGMTIFYRRSALRRRLRRFDAFVKAVVAHDLGDAQAVITEDAGAAGALGLAVLLVAAPSGDRFFVAPEREREDLAFLGQALETLDRDESVDLLELGAQLRGDLEIVLAPLGFGLDLEDDRIHAHSFRLDSRARPQCSGRIRLISPSKRPSHRTHSPVHTTSFHGPSSLARSARRRVSSSISRFHCRTMRLVSRSLTVGSIPLACSAPRRNVAGAPF